MIEDLPSTQLQLHVFLNDFESKCKFKGDVRKCGDTEFPYEENSCLKTKKKFIMIK